MRSYLPSHFSSFVSASLLLLVAAIAPAAHQRRKENTSWLQKELELTQNDCDGLEHHMRGVRSMDQTIFAKTDLSPTQARAMSTEGLIMKTVKSGIYIFYTLYSKPTVGIYRATLTSPTLQELSRRKDLGQGFAAAYTHMKLDPKKDPTFEKDGGCMRLYSTDLLVNYPPFRRKLVGHEREVITAMLACHKRAEIVNKQSRKGNEPFGVMSTTVESAAAVLAQAKPGQKINLSKFKSEDEALKAILASLNRP